MLPRDLRKTRCLAGVLGPDLYQTCHLFDAPVRYSFMPPVSCPPTRYTTLFLPLYALVLAPKFFITVPSLPYFHFLPFILRTLLHIPKLVENIYQTQSRHYSLGLG